MQYHEERHKSATDLRLQHIKDNQYSVPSEWAIMQKGSTFYDEAMQVRREFVKVAAAYDVGRHNALRTEIDSLLIMYDQAIEKAKKLDELLDDDCPACASGTDHCGY